MSKSFKFATHFICSDNHSTKNFPHNTLDLFLIFQIKWYEILCTFLVLSNSEYVLVNVIQIFYVYNEYFRCVFPTCTNNPIVRNGEKVLFCILNIKISPQMCKISWNPERLYSHQKQNSRMNIFQWRKIIPYSILYSFKFSRRYPMTWLYLGHVSTKYRRFLYKTEIAN